MGITLPTNGNGDLIPTLLPPANPDPIYYITRDDASLLCAGCADIARDRVASWHIRRDEEPLRCEVCATTI